jgi:hypothetical protein
VKMTQRRLVLATRKGDGDMVQRPTMAWSKEIQAATVGG